MSNHDGSKNDAPSTDRGGGGGGGTSPNTSGPLPLPGTGGPAELLENTRVFRPPTTIPPTAPVLAALAAGTRETVTPTANLAAAVEQAGPLAATFFGAGAPAMEEMPPSYAPQYPYNTVLTESESGHLIEVDDTPGAERVHVYHRTGSHIEMRPDGSVKYKTTKTRQDITIGDHEVLIEGDWNIVVSGGYNIRTKNGEFIIEANDGAAVNVTGKLKLSADDIELKATNHIFLNAPKVDIGAIAPGGMPMISLPGGVTFNERYPFDPTLVPRVNIPLAPAGVSALTKTMNLPDTRFAGVDRSVNDVQRRAPSDSGIDLLNVVERVGSAISTLVAIPRTLKLLTSALKLRPPMPSNAMLQAALKKSLTTDALDASGEPAFSRLKEQPGILPLSNPHLYKKTPATRAQRARAFDSPDDVQNAESYNAHINLSVELQDYEQTARTSPGAPIESDTVLPAPEPHPPMAFTLISGGTASINTDSAVLTGHGTKFTEDVLEGQTIALNGVKVVVQSIADDTTLTLTQPWSAASLREADMRTYRLRPMQEFFGVFEYGDGSPLGESGLTLGDVCVNFQSPIIEVPRVNTAMLTFGLGTPLMGGSGQGECGTPWSGLPNEYDVVKDVYGDGSQWDLTTDDGGGEFVDAVVRRLGGAWGHIRKSGGQTQAFGHAVDAIMYKDGTEMAPGKFGQVVDIISGHGGPDAAPAWQPMCSPVTGDDWYQ